MAGQGACLIRAKKLNSLWLSIMSDHPSADMSGQTRNLFVGACLGC